MIYLRIYVQSNDDNTEFQYDIKHILMDNNNG